MAKHSQEPWHVGGVGGCRPKLVYDASGRTILRSWGNGSDEENEANVELAAQAPKLREQVHALREELEKLRANVRAVGSDEMVVKRADWEARAQSADVVTVPREEWEALGQIVTLVNKHINDPCYLRNQLVPIVDRVSALRSGEAGKGAG